MILSADTLKNYNLDDTTKSIWGISRSYDNVFLDPDVIAVVDLEDPGKLEDTDLLWQATYYLGVISKMLDEWMRIRVTQPALDEILSYRDRCMDRVRSGEDASEGEKALGNFADSVEGVTATLADRVLDLGQDIGESNLYEHLRDLLELFDDRIGITKSEGEDRARMIHQVCVMYVLTLTRKGECSVLAHEQGYEGLITIPFRNLLAREVDDPDSPLNVLRGSRVTAILPDDNGKFRRNFVSSWVSPNDRVFVTVAGVEDHEARDRVLELVRLVAEDLADLGFSGEKYRLDISTDRDTLESLFEDLIKRTPRPGEGQTSLSFESLVPVWEKIGEICGVMGFHVRRDEALRHLSSIRGRRFALEIDRLKQVMDEISADPDWHSNPDRLEEFQRAQKDMLALLERRRRR